MAKFRSGDSDACAENFSHSAQLLLQQSRASYMLPFALGQSLYQVLTRELNEDARGGCNA